MRLIELLHMNYITVYEVYIAVKCPNVMKCFLVDLCHLLSFCFKCPSFCVQGKNLFIFHTKFLYVKLGKSGKIQYVIQLNVI